MPAARVRGSWRRVKGSPLPRRFSVGSVVRPLVLRMGGRRDGFPL